jgi:hypothetical protein
MVSMFAAIPSAGSALLGAMIVSGAFPGSRFGDRQKSITAFFFRSAPNSCNLKY